MQFSMVGEETSYIAVGLFELKFLFSWAVRGLGGACMEPALSPQASESSASASASRDSTATWDVISQHVHSLQLQVNLLDSRIRVLEDRSDLADQAQGRLDRRVSLIEHWCQSLRNFFARLP